jgi:DNA-binding winged helix-turn-helix (wHTH) protein/tetratricopeptide (TPR) repeat protein
VKPSYRFGPFELDGRAYRLMRDGAPLDLPPKVLDLLFLFLSRPAALITKDEIFDALWPGVSVTDNAITQVVSDLRDALDDSPAAPTWVQTVPRRGYRFIGEITSTQNLEPGTQSVGQEIRSSEFKVPSSEFVKRRVSVGDFTNLSGDASLDWLTAGLAETLTNDLRAVPELSVIDRVTPAQAAMLGTTRAPAADLVVVGSVQRAGDRLRLMARVIDSTSREAIAQARADGAMTELFDLQDAIVTQLSTGLQLRLSPAAAARMHARETSSLDAYRAVTEGRLKLETLDPAAVPDAIADFSRALELDARYALAHVGLAHALFWRFQASRAEAAPDVGALAASISHARRAVELDADLAEAHSALALVLSAADRHGEAVAAGRLAVSLDPANWRHQFRYGVAAWGAERETALGRAAAMFPPLGFTYFGLAMLHVARGNLTAAAAALDTGIAHESAGPAGAARLPGNGLHWLRGLVALAGGYSARAREEFDRELARVSLGLFGREYAMDACVGHAYASARGGDFDAAAHLFEQALARYPDHARSWLGLADVRYRQGRRADTEAALSRGLDAIDGLRRLGRASEAALAAATGELIAGRRAGAVAALARLLDEAPAGHAGWSIPVEPAFADLHGDPAFASVLERLAQRAQ